MGQPASAFVEGTLAQRFRAIWDETPEEGEEWPDVFAWLAGHPSAEPAQVADVLLVDLHQRFRREGPLPPERYLDAFPQVAREPELALLLIGGELRTRREWGEAIDVRAFAMRFPRWRDRIVERFAPRSPAVLPNGPARDAEFGDDVPAAKSPARRRKKISWLARLALVVLVAAGCAGLGLKGMALGYERLSPTPLDIQVIAPDDWLVGSRVAIGARLADGATGVPMPDVPLAIRLVGARGEVLTKAESPGEGPGGDLRWVALAVPDVPGRLTLRVDAIGREDAESIELPVTIRRDARLMISADKPIYRPGQVIRLRGLALREPDLKPLAGRPAAIRVLDAKGNVIFRHEQATSRFGIAAAECPLAAEAMTGTYTLRLTVGEFEGEAKVQVEPYVLPKIEVALTLDKPVAAPGEPIAGTVRARYVFGEPVAGGTVRIWSPAGGKAVEVRTDEEGRARFEWPGLPPSGDNPALLELLTRVEDAAGQRQDLSTPVTVAANSLRLEAWCDGGEFVPGLSNLIYVRVRRGDGKPVAATVMATGDRTIAAGEDGLAVFELTEVPATGLFLSAKAEGGEAVRTTFLPPVSAAGARLLADRVFVREGEPVAVTLQRKDAVPESIVVEAIQDGRPIAGAALGEVGKEGSATIALPEGVSGRVTLVARRWGGGPIAWRPIEVLSGRRLAVKASWDRPEYRPGESARLQFLVTDAEGRPAPGALSVALVDRAVGLAFGTAQGEAPTAIGGEWAYFRPGAMDGSGDERLARAELSRDAGAPSLAAVQVASLYREKAARVEARRMQGLAWVEERTRWLGMSLVAALGGLAAAALVLWVLALRPEIRNAVFAATGATAVLVALTTLFVARTVVRGTADASKTAEAIAKSERPMAGAEMPMEGAAPSPMSRSGDADEPRLRKDFPETLLWRPELVTDDQGRAEVELALADSITTWKLMAGAVSAEGGLGGATSEMRAFQPFQVDLNLPGTLTRGDRADIPVVVYNFLDRLQEVTVTLGGDGLEPAERIVALGPNEVRSVSYPLRAERVGRFVLRAKGVGQGVSDAIERAVDVVPDGRLVEQIANGILREPAAMDFAVPADAVLGSVRLQVKLYPTTFSQVMDGLEGIFAMPLGCFEQTSATTYPNLLALDYLKRTKAAKPDVEERARGLVRLGYQRLLTFEVPGGGFDWFGRAPANRVLTAYGLMEFRDMARVADVDPKLIDRTREWLMGQRQPDGSWLPESHGIREGINTYTDGDRAALRATAYIAWAAWDGEAEPRDAGPTQEYLLKAPPESIDEPYTLALMANALLAMDPSKVSARPYIEKLIALHRKSAGAGGGPPWGDGEGDRPRTIFLGRGETRDVETASLSALALIRAGAAPDVSAATLEWLIGRRGPGGAWGSTQATVLALKALLAGTQAPLGDGERAVELALDAGEPRRVVIPADQSDVVKVIDLGEGLAPGSHRLALADVSKGGTTYQVIFRHHVPGDSPEPRPEPLKIALEYEKTDLKVFETIAARARVENASDSPAPMAIARLPVPPGFALEGVDAPAEAEKVETAPDAVTLYLRELAPGRSIDMTYRLRPLMPLAVAVPPARVYEYYDPDRGGSGGAARLVVAGE